MRASRALSANTNSHSARAEWMNHFHMNDSYLTVFAGRPCFFGGLASSTFLGLGCGGVFAIRRITSSRRVAISSASNSTSGCRAMTDEPFDLVEVAKDVVKRGESSVVIMAVSILEDWLEGTLKAKMKPLSSTVENRLFGGQAPLRSFAAKIDIAFAFGVIDEKVQNQMRALKDIRNAFAHAKTLLFLDSSELTGDFQRLSGWKKGCDLRALFQNSIDFCLEPLRLHLDVKALADALLAYKPEEATLATLPETTAQE
jgi:hypothetical protein